MARLAGVVVALATTAAVLTGSTVGAAPPPAASDPATNLPREIPGGVELTLADGDLLRVWTSRDHRTVRSTRRDAATGAWGEKQEVLRRKNLYCGDVDARTANGAVAAIALCDEGGYAEDTAPTSSRALWTADTVTWASYELDGEAYEEPGISPDGSNAVWPLHQGYATRTPAGFASHRLAADGQEYTVTATITDAEQVSFLYGGTAGRGRCGLVVLTRTGNAAPSRQELSFDGACSDSGFANVDSDTTWFGDLAGVAGRAVISRPDGASPWAVTEIAPSTAPGLEEDGPGLYRDFFTAPGLPLVAVAGGPGGVIRSQVYDRSAQAWGSPTEILDPPGRCSWDDNWTAESLAVIAVRLRCSGRGLVLTTADGTGWQALRTGRHPAGLSPDGRYVAVPGRSRTYVISAERGVVALPGGVTGRCDVVVPDGPDGAVLLTSRGRHRGWPTVLQHSSSEGWSTLSRTSLPTFEPRCTGARSSTYDLPYRFDIRGRMKGYTVEVVERSGTWAVRRSRY